MTQNKAARDAVAAMGSELGPAVLARCVALYDEEQTALARAMPASATDLAYGPDPRHRLDLYAAHTKLAPIMVFFHGGGFRVGDKGSGDRWPNASVGRMAARAGFLGVVPNYRLTPDYRWPSGGEDVAAVVAWLREHAEVHGGDPERIVLVGTSAGAVHIATWLQRGPAAPVCGIALLSGFYGYTPLGDRDTSYFGDAAEYRERRPLEAVAATKIPLFLACAEFDPARFKTEYVNLLKHRLDNDGDLPLGFVVSGHNHYTMTLHLGTSDTRLAEALLAFARRL